MAGQVPTTARAVYRALLRTVEQFPREPILGARADGALSFDEVCALRLRALQRKCVLFLCGAALGAHVAVHV